MYSLVIIYKTGIVGSSSFCFLIVLMVQILIQLVKRVLVWVVLLIMLAIVLNRVVAWIYGWAIWWFDWWLGDTFSALWSVVILFLLIIVFPVLYIWNMKILVVASVLLTIRWRYKDQFMEFVVRRAVHSTLALRKQWSQLVKSGKTWFDDLPLTMRVFFSWLKQKIPFLGYIETILVTVDWERNRTEAELQAEVMEQLHHKMQATGVSVDRTVIWMILWANVLLVLLIVIVV